MRAFAWLFCLDQLILFGEANRHTLRDFFLMQSLPQELLRLLRSNMELLLSSMSQDTILLNTARCHPWAPTMG